MIFKVRLTRVGKGAGALKKSVNLEPFLQTCPKTPSSQFKTAHSMLDVNMNKIITLSLMLKFELTEIHLHVDCRYVIKSSCQGRIFPSY